MSGSQEKALQRRERLVQYRWRLGFLVLTEIIWGFALRSCMVHGFHGRYDQLAMYIATGLIVGAFWGYAEWGIRASRSVR